MLNLEKLVSRKLILILKMSYNYLKRIAFSSKFAGSETVVRNFFLSLRHPKKLRHNLAAPQDCKIGRIKVIFGGGTNVEVNHWSNRQYQKNTIYAHIVDNNAFSLVLKKKKRINFKTTF